MHRMTCREFAHIVRDLALDRVPGAARRDADDHAGTCAACAARLGEQRELSLCLAVLTQSVAHREAPPRVEAAVLRAFRALHPVVSEAGGAAESVSHWSRGWMPWVGAAAAMAMVTVASYMLLPGAQDSSPEVAAQTAPRRESPPVPAIPEPAVAVLREEPPAEAELKRPSAAVSQEPARVDTESGNPEEIIAATSTAPRSETMQSVSDFYPLLYGGDPMLLRTAPIVRVEMSGAMLQALGFPIVGEPSARRIQADLVLGEDGLARAIRFVQ
jgi:hypothetical protein